MSDSVVNKGPTLRASNGTARQMIGRDVARTPPALLKSRCSVAYRAAEAAELSPEMRLIGPPSLRTVADRSCLAAEKKGLVTISRDVPPKVCRLSSGSTVTLE
jgi:hypothetical protein